MTKLEIVRKEIVLNTELVDLGDFYTHLKGVLVHLGTISSQQVEIIGQRECDNNYTPEIAERIKYGTVVEKDAESTAVARSTAVLRKRYFGLFGNATFDVRRAYRKNKSEEDRFPQRGIIMRDNSDRMVFLYFQKAIMAKKPYAIFALFEITPPEEAKSFRFLAMHY